VIPQAVCSRYGLAIGANLVWFVKLLMLMCWPISYPVGKVSFASFQDIVCPCLIFLLPGPTGCTNFSIKVSLLVEIILNADIRLFVGAQ